MIQLTTIDVSYATEKQKFTKKDLYSTDVKTYTKRMSHFQIKDLNRLDFSQKASEDVTTRWDTPYSGTGCIPDQNSRLGSQF